MIMIIYKLLYISIIYTLAKLFIYGEVYDNNDDLIYHHLNLSEKQLNVIENCLNNHNGQSCYILGNALLQETSIFGDRNIHLGYKYLLRSAEQRNILGCHTLGKLYYSNNYEYSYLKPSIKKALYWFEIASELGHQGSTYNVGLIYSQGHVLDNIDIDLTKALKFFKLAYGYGSSDSIYNSYASEETTSAAFTAHGIISDMLSTSNNVIFNPYLLTNIWNNSDIHQYSDHDLDLNHNKKLSDIIYRCWKQGVDYLMKFDELFRTKNGIVDIQVIDILKQIVNNFSEIVDNYSQVINRLQLHLVLEHLQDAIGPLAGYSDEYAYKAGLYAEAFALSHYCRGRYASWESDSACFNGAVSSAMSYYRRANDSQSAMRVFLMAQNHPLAATHWRYLAQTPRVLHPNLRASPWWNPSDFTITNTLQAMFHDPSKGKAIQQQLDYMIAMKRGTLRDIRPPDIVDHQIKDEEHIVNKPIDGLRNIFTPYIGVRNLNYSSSTSTTTQTATQLVAHIVLVSEDSETSGWSEFGPLFNGIEWSDAHCKVLPTICETLQNYLKQQHQQQQRRGSGGVNLQEDIEEDSTLTTSELCGTHTTEEMFQNTSHYNILNNNNNKHDNVDNQMVNKMIHKRIIEDHCGSDTIVTILRLKPGTHILPHCGTTNRRLIMHFVLRGAKGVNFRVGDGSIYESNVKDTSDHIINTNTTTTRTGTSTEDEREEKEVLSEISGENSKQQIPEQRFGGFKIKVNNNYQPLTKKSKQIDEYGWMSSYGGEGENGLAIVFDDSFEHEVTHKGDDDRYVILIVLKHPDVIY